MDNAMTKPNIHEQNRALHRPGRPQGNHFRLGGLTEPAGSLEIRAGSVRGLVVSILCILSARSFQASRRDAFQPGGIPLRGLKSTATLESSLRDCRIHDSCEFVSIGGSTLP